jgi:integrase
VKNLVEQKRDLIRSGSRILVPSELRSLREALNPEYRIIIDGLIHTGARGVEFWAIVKHPEWFHAGRRIIDLPKVGAAKKQKMKHTDRTIKLTINGVYAMQNIYTNGIKFKSRSALNQALKRAAIKAGINPIGINSKCFRKILISWLVEIRKDVGIDSLDITTSMGHTKDTMIEDYLGMAFSRIEHDDMLDFLKGWGIQ